MMRKFLCLLFRMKLSNSNVPTSRLAHISCLPKGRERDLFFSSWSFYWMETWGLSTWIMTIPCTTERLHANPVWWKRTVKCCSELDLAFSSKLCSAKNKKCSQVWKDGSAFNGRAGEQRRTRTWNVSGGSSWSQGWRWDEFPELKLWTCRRPTCQWRHPIICLRFAELTLEPHGVSLDIPQPSLRIPHPNLHPTPKRTSTCPRALSLFPFPRNGRRGASRRGGWGWLVGQTCVFLFSSFLQWWRDRKRERK